MTDKRKVGRILTGVNYKKNVREHKRGNEKWTIQRNWQHTCTCRVHKTKKNNTKTQ